MQENNEIKNNNMQENKTNDQFDNEIASCFVQLQECQDRYLRLSADFENYKKREEKNRASLSFIMQAELLRGFLNIIDNWQRALADQPKEVNEEVRNWIKGFELIDKEIQKYLEKTGIEEITESKDFNPEIHEAIMQSPSDAHKSGEVIAVLQKGYRYKGELLRPAKVSIAQ